MFNTMLAYSNRIIVAVVVLGVVLGGIASAQRTVVFVDWSWDSAIVHNRIAAFIAEHGFGLETDYLMADTVAGVQGMRRGDIDVSMETWIDNTPEIWNDALDEGLLVDLGYNFLEAPQGWYVPTYVIKGDPERGIEPMAPDLQSVYDLPEHWEIFRDRENPRKGRFYNGITGWIISEYNTERLKVYGLADTFENFYPGSQAAADTSIVRAFERGEAWLGYYWEPTWIMGKYDMTMLEEPEYNEECWDEEEGDFGCAFPSADVKILANAKFAEREPEFIQFLKNYETELSHTNEILAYMETEGVEALEAAEWFLREYEALWTGWLDDHIVAKVKVAL